MEGEHLQIFGQVVEIALLAGIFLKLGRFGAVIEFHETRLEKIEEKIS